MTYGVNAPLGFEPVGTIIGAPWNGATRSFTINSTIPYATAIFSGDPIAMKNDGTIILAAAGSTTNPMFGVFQGCQYTLSTGVLVKSNFWPGAGVTLAPNTVIEAYCTVDPNILYSIQTNSAAGAVLANNFQNANFAAGTGNTLNGQSTFSLDLGSVATTPTLNCKILQSATTPNVSSWVPVNTWGVGYNNVIVMVNNHALKAGTAGPTA